MKALKLAVRELSNNYKEYVKRRDHRKARKLTESILLNLDVIHSLEGAKSSAQFEKKALRDVPHFKNRKELFSYSLDQIGEINNIKDRKNSNLKNNGLYLEFGTFKGDSVNLLAKLAKDKHFYGFDSFEGMPEGWTPDCKKGTFDLGGRLPLVRENVTLIPGWYDKSLPKFLADKNLTNHAATVQSQSHSQSPSQATTQIAFLHIDCDLYSSTKTIFEQLGHMIVPGTVICFDEYYNYPDWEEGEYKAFQELVQEKGLKFEYIGYIRIGRQLAVKII